MIDFRDVIVQWLDDDSAPFQVTVVVGDGDTVFDDTFEFDERVFYYFNDEHEFNSHKSQTFGNEFRILEVV